MIANCVTFYVPPLWLWYHARYLYRIILLSGDGGVYPSAIQALLPRLLLAAAPGRSSCENHRQCLKVSRLIPNCAAI